MATDQYAVLESRTLDNCRTDAGRHGGCCVWSTGVTPAGMVTGYSGETTSLTAGFVLAMAVAGYPSCGSSVFADLRGDRGPAVAAAQPRQAMAGGMARTYDRMPGITSRPERIDYRESLAVLRDVVRTPVPRAVQRSLSAAIGACHLPEARNGVPRYEAERLLEAFRHELVDDYAFLRELSRGRPRNPYPLLAGLLFDSEAGGRPGSSWRRSGKHLPGAEARRQRLAEMAVHNRLITVRPGKSSTAKRPVVKSRNSRGRLSGDRQKHV